MAISGKKIMFLGVLMAELLVVATAGAVTVHNPAMIPLDLLTNNITVVVDTGIMSLNFTGEEQEITITSPTGGVVSVDMKTDEVLVVLPPLLFNGGTFPTVQLVTVPFDFSSAAASETPDADQSDSEDTEP